MLITSVLGIHISRLYISTPDLWPTQQITSGYLRNKSSQTGS